MSTNGISSTRVAWMLALAALAVFATVEEVGCSSEPTLENVGAGSTQEQPLVSDNRGDPARTGVYYDETNLLTPTNVAVDGGFAESPTRYIVDGPIYAQPLIVPGVGRADGGAGLTDILLIATTKNHFYGFDARKPGSGSLWEVKDDIFGVAANIGMNPFNDGAVLDSGAYQGIGGNRIDCANIGNIGILSTPVVDGTNAYVMTASGMGGSHQFTLWAIDIATGAVVTHQAIGTPTVTGADGGTITFNPGNHIQRPALALARANNKPYVIAAFSSSCDSPLPFYGWVFAFDVSGTTQMPVVAPSLTGIFNDSRSAAVPAAPWAQGGIWMSGAGPAIDPQGNIYLLSGNGDGYEAGSVFSNSAIKLTINGSGQFVEPLHDSTSYFTPSNWHDLQACDLDLGVSGITYIADNTQPMLLFGSKLGKAYLLNATNLGGVGNPQDSRQVACNQFSTSTSGSACSGDAALIQPSARNCEATGTQLPPTYTQGVFCPIGQSSDGAAGTWPTSGCPAGQQVWPHIHGSPVFWANGPDAVFLSGQYDYIRRLDVDRTNHVFKDMSSNTYFAHDIAPTEGYGAILSLADTQVGGVHKGVLFANVQAPRGVNKADGGAWATHSLAELAFGALYAINADPTGGLYPWLQPLFNASSSDPWLLAKFTPPTIYRGSVYLATMSNQVIVFGVDKDGDKIPDGLDNCPSVSNVDQRNTNEDAERMMGLPLLGDACDPNATTRLQVLAATVTDNALANNLVMNTGLSFTGYIGNDAGEAGTTVTGNTTAPVFCKCANATTDELTRRKCLLKSSLFGGGGDCNGADDPAFPPLDGGTPVHLSRWKQITQMLNGTPQPFAPQSITHSEPKFAGPSAFAGWDFYRDLGTFNLPNDGGVGTALEGVAWSHVLSFNPADSTELPAPSSNPGINNHYPAMLAKILQQAWVPSNIVNLPIYYRIPPCNPWGGNPSWWLLPLNGTGLMASYGSGGGLLDETSRFTAGAQSLMASLNGQGSTSDLVLNDGVRIISTRGMVGAVVTRSGTTLQVNGALVASGNQIDSVGTSDGASTPTVANFVSYTMDVERELLHVLTRDPGSGAQALQSVNLRQTLHGVAGISHPLTGSTFATPLSLQYNNQKGSLYLLDRLDSGGNSSLRLLSIGLDGTTQVLWTTVAVASANFPTQAFLSADSSGALTVSVTVPSGAAAEVMTVDGAGAPQRSFEGTTAIASSVVAEPNGSLWIVGKTLQPGTANWALNPARYDLTQLLPSICAASWLRSVAGSTGLLATGVAGCAPVTNGGFETGDFQWWTPSGASETISTTAHNGKYSALLGLSTPTNGDSTIKQTITVPSSGGTLTLWYSTTCPDTVQYDWFTASLQSTLGATLATVVSKTCVASSGWTSATYNLSAYANQTIVVVITNHDDNYGSDPTYTLVDDVSVQ